MKIMVLGSGIIGTTTAWYLAEKGHEVHVIDRQATAGQETSFANAGQISPGYSAPWAAPGIPLKALKWMLSKHSPLVIHPTTDPAFYRFLVSILGECNEQRYSINKSRMLRLAEYSRSVLNQYLEQHHPQFCHQKKGTLQLFRKPAQLKQAKTDVQILQQSGVEHELLSVAECVDREPALGSISSKLVGGLRLPNDQTGDCQQLTQALAESCKDSGVQFHYGEQIQSVSKNLNRITAVTTDQGEYSADVYVMAMGSYSGAFLKSLGIHSPVYPVKGYSITLPIHNADMAPRSTLMDESYKVAITRLGERIRVAGMAELHGFNLQLREKRRSTLHYVVKDLFPQAFKEGVEDEFWTGLRPMTPDGTPLVGASPVDNLFLNTGHGTLGWTMAFGSARLIADLISGHKPEITHEDLDLSRYG